MAGYHLRNIPKGVFGELSKIKEEIEEIEDSIDQNSKVMEVMELSDLYGAIQGYLEKYHPDVTMEDLRIMSDITQRAFRSGARG